MAERMTSIKGREMHSDGDQNEPMLINVGRCLWRAWPVG
jgi:hypothetical protein